MSRDYFSFKQNFITEHRPKSTRYILNFLQVCNAYLKKASMCELSTKRSKNHEASKHMAHERESLSIFVFRIKTYKIDMQDSFRCNLLTRYLHTNRSRKENHSALHSLKLEVVKKRSYTGKAKELLLFPLSLERRGEEA